MMKKPARMPDAASGTTAGLIVIQAIRITWTKATRDSQHAAMRSNLPRALEIPEPGLPSPKPEYVTHALHYDEKNAFQSADSSISSGTLAEVLANYTFDDTSVQYWRISAWNIGLLPMNDALRVDLWWSDGMPWRDTIRGLFYLEPNQWASLRYNWRSSAGRFEGDAYYKHDYRDATWHYGQIVLNIGLFSQLSEDVFMRQKPNFRHVDMARLR